MRTHKIVTFVLGFTSLQANVVSALPSDGSGAWTRSLPGGSGTQALEDRDAATDISLRSDVTSLDSLELASDLERRSYKDLVDWWGQVSTIPTMALWCLGLTYGAHKVVLKYTTEAQRTAVYACIAAAARRVGFIRTPEEVRRELHTTAHAIDEVLELGPHKRAADGDYDMQYEDDSD